MSNVFKYMIKKLLKYTILFCILFISCLFITKSKITNIQSIIISLIGATSFAIIDQYAPSYIINEK